MPPERHRAVPSCLGLGPRGLSRGQAAHYIGVGTSLFDAMVKERIMPAPIRYRGRVFWDRNQLDAAMDALSDIHPDCSRGADQWLPVA